MGVIMTILSWKDYFGEQIVNKDFQSTFTFSLIYITGDMFVYSLLFLINQHMVA